MSMKRLVGRFLSHTAKPVQFKSARRKANPGCELFEDRVVLSHMGGMPGGFGGRDFGGFDGGHRGRPPAQFGSFKPGSQGGDLLGSLGSLGILPGPGGFGGDFDHGMPKNTVGSTTDTTTSTLFTNLQTAMTQMATDAKAIAANSGVTVADMSALMTDAQAIRNSTTSTIDVTKLNTAVSELAYAVAGGTDQTTAKADLSAALSAAGVPQATIDKSTADLVQAITDSKVTTANLDTLKADKAAVDAAQQALKDAGITPDQGHGQGTCDGDHGSSSTTTSTSGASSTNSSSSSSSSVKVASASTLKSATRGVMRVRRAGRHR